MVVVVGVVVVDGWMGGGDGDGERADPFAVPVTGSESPIVVVLSGSMEPA
jgi:hypothetical protein